jgi:hypothetical protein
MNLSKFACLLGASLTLVGCNHVAAVRVEQENSKEFATAAAPRIVVETFNGAIHVQSSADNQVRAVVTRAGFGVNEADAQEDLAEIDVVMQQEENTVRITARRNGDRPFGASEASVRVTAPAAASLELTTSNGSVDSQGIAGPHKLRTSNGAINVAGAKSALTAETSNGSITLHAENAVVHAVTSNGIVGFQGSLAPGKHEFRASNGAIQLTLPKDSAFNVDASTSNGSVTTDFDFKTTDRNDRCALKGSVGDKPVTEIMATTGNGAIQIRRGW